MLVSEGYPGDYEKGKTISGLELVHDSIVFHAGTSYDPSGENILSAGGRVIAVTSFGNTIREAFQKSYTNANKIRFENKYLRKDLGQDLLKYLP
jgi:phosphoribosylamine--glycine ligase